MPKKEERLRSITNILESHPVIHIHTLQKMTKYSVSTLRRDLIYLEEKGLIQRSFGSIRLLNQQNLEYTWDYRSNEHSRTKREISRLASRLIKDNDAIFIDASTTSIGILDFIGNKRGIKVITNNLKVAEKAQRLAQVKTFLAGGEVKTLSETLIGADANDYIKQFHARLAFLSSSTIMPDGLHMADVNQTQVKRTMVRNADIIVALLDHSKFTNHHNFVRLCGLNALDYLITDRKPVDTAILQALHQSKVNIIYK